MTDDRIEIDEAIYMIEKAELAIIPASLPTGGDDYDEGWMLVPFEELGINMISTEKCVRTDRNLRDLILSYANND